MRDPTWAIVLCDSGQSAQALLALLPRPSIGMAVVESPRLSNKSAPDGALVLVTPDPVSSVAALKDPEATVAAERLHPPTILAYIQMATNVDWSRHASQQPLSFIFNFVMRSLPKPPFAFIPLSPEGSSYHPSGRAPLLPSIPLPWPDCFLYTQDTFVARVSRIFLTDPGKVCQLSREQRRTVTRTYVEDIQTPDPDEPPRTVKHPSPPPSPEASERDPQESPRAHLRLLQDQSEPPVVEYQESETTTDDDDSEASSTEESDDAPRELVLSAEIRLDLSSVREIGTFDNYVEYIRQLYRIEREWANRTLLRELADQPETQRWAADVATASATEPDEGTRVEPPTTGLIAPTDRPKSSSLKEPGSSEPGRASSQDSRHANAAKLRLLSSVANSVSKRVKSAILTIKLVSTRIQDKRQRA
ncbi:hypothetical protein AURDEDRAFT_167706 [Auricularia subglabra TFB-10046 SS5]|nr:hypothetical protein AURDEDRAFT_167706 [Auricularia subglabra TFB-10046 SS5]